MYKLILITVIMLLCLSVVVEAQPLPLIPQEQAVNEVTATTANNNEETKQTKKETEQTTNGTETTTKSATGDTTKESTVQPSAAQSSDLASAMESGHEKWFELKDKSKGEIEKLSTALEQEGDYRSKAKRGHLLLEGKEVLGETAAFGADSLRGAMDTLMGWDFTHGTNK